MSRIEKALEKAAKLRDAANLATKGPIEKGTVEKNTEGISQEDVIQIEGASPYIITLEDPGSQISEEYRKLKSMVVKMTKRDGFKNTIMITSSIGGEGKSITAANLAVSLSQEYDHTVLLVDADLRNPSLDRYLNIQADIGLINCLYDGIDVGSAIFKLGNGKLTFLPAGKLSVNDPVELLSSMKMKELLSEIKHRYSDRYIIIDTTPILSFAETFSLSSLVDGVVFVAREGVTSEQGIRDSLEILKESNVLGIVYNGVNIESIYGDYYSQYGYYRYNRPEG